MKKIGKIILYGFILWLSVFIASFLIFPIKKINPVYFETGITIILTFFTILYTSIYLRKINTDFFKAGVYIGLAWLFINILLDLPLFLTGPMKMPIEHYFMDIGLTYVAIPIITIGMGYNLSQKTK